MQDLTVVVASATLAVAMQKRAPLYDKSQEGHHNLISALHKSIALARTRTRPCIG